MPGKSCAVFWGSGRFSTQILRPEKRDLRTLRMPVQGNNLPGGEGHSGQFRDERRACESLQDYRRMVWTRIAEAATVDGGYG